MADNKIGITLTASDKTKAAFDSVKHNLFGINSIASGLSTGLASLGVGLSAGAFGAFIKNAIDAGDEIAKMSQKVGVSVEALGELKYAGSLADVSLEQIGTGMKRLAVNMADAKRGTGEAVTAFKQIGIDPAQFKTTDAALKAIADKFAQMPDGANKTAVAMKLMGKSGADMIPLLNGGSAAMNQAAAEARSMGLVMSEEAAKSAEEFNDNLTRIKASASGLGVQLANNILPGLTEVSKAMAEAAKEGSLLKVALVGIGGVFTSILTDEFATIETKIGNQQRLLKQYQDSLHEIGTGGVINNLLFGQGDVEHLVANIKKTEAAIAALQKQKDELAKPKPTAKKDDPFAIDVEGLEKFNQAIQKSLDTKPFDDYINKLKQSTQSVEAEWAKFKAALTPQETLETPSILDVGESTSTARIALAGGDQAAFDSAIEQGKARLKTYAEQGGGIEVGYLADQMRDLELEMVAASQKAAESARTSMQRAFVDLSSQAEALKIAGLTVDVEDLKAQARSAQEEVARQLSANPMVVPIIVRPTLDVQGGSDLQTASLKYGSR